MSETIVQAVKDKYGSVANSGLSSNHEGVKAVAQAFGYTPEELASIPAEANMGLSCGNPTAVASLREGEVVVDLGSGGGLDVLLAARKVGPTGKAIGIDMTQEMIDLARRNAAKSGLANIEYHLATIDKLPLPDASVDCVISNCVINLAPDKTAVFREIARVLKPGGRLAVSDIALKRELPPEIGSDLMAYVGCIAGAILIEDYRQMLGEAGFAHVAHRQRQRSERLRQGREPGGMLLSPDICRIGLGDRRWGWLHAGASGGGGRGVARTSYGPTETLRRERVRRQREGLCLKAPMRSPSYHTTNSLTPATTRTTIRSRRRVRSLRRRLPNSAPTSPPMAAATAQ